MHDGTHGGVLAAFSRAQREIEQWRRRHRPRARLPDELWREAVELARTYGINPTARALRLDYYSLKKRLIVEAGEDQRTAKPPAEVHRAPEFLEILPGGLPAQRPQCVVEIEEAGGVKLRIHLQGGDFPDVAAITRAFREGCR
ncbi:MAG TPA: hypothetical protein VHO91_10310 [Rhodopila sp.]|nr:hypothetical protein [Rhodopila sp.]